MDDPRLIAASLSRRWWFQQLRASGVPAPSGLGMLVVRIGGQVVGFIGAYEGTRAALSLDGRWFATGPVDGVLDAELSSAVEQELRSSGADDLQAVVAVARETSAAAGEGCGPTLEPMDANTTIRVRTVCEAHVDGQRRDVDLQLWHTTSDPLAVHMDIKDGFESADWVFALELLDLGRWGVTGGGLVQVHPERTESGRKIIVVSLRGDNGSMQLAMSRTLVDLFLDQCRRHSSDEHIDAMVDSELDRLLRGGS